MDSIASMRAPAPALVAAAALAMAPERVPAGPAFVGRSPAVLRLLEHVDTLAASDAPVLVTGASGTGKELIARRLHARSARGHEPFVAVNCAAFPETLLEAELFGHERGAFTGAVRRREGRFQAAHGGTLFLDEVAEIPPAGQAKLLRVLEEGAFEPLGTNRTVIVDVRIVSATHRDLRERIASGLFREDLYYRLKVLQLRVPALGERGDDVPLLVEHFLRRFAPPGRRPTPTPAALAAIGRYPFPGNVRELEHAIQHAVVLARGGEIDLEHLPPEIGSAAGPGEAPAAPPAPEPRGVTPLALALAAFERDHLIRALRACGGRRARAAAALGISRKNLWERMRRLRIGSGEIA